MSDKLSPLQVILACFTVSSFAGLAAYLRGGQPITLRNLSAAVLYSGMCGLVLGLVWYNYFDGSSQNYFFLIGMSGLAGLGGVSLLDFLVQALSKGGLNVTVKPIDADDRESSEAGSAERKRKPDAQDRSQS